MDNLNELYSDSQAEIIMDEPVYLVCKEGECTASGKQTFTPYKLGIKTNTGLCEYPYSPDDER